MTALIPLLILTACIEDVGKDKAAAIVEDVPVESVENVAAGNTWAVDLSASKVQALGAKVTKAFPLIFHEFGGEVTVDDGVVSAVSFVIEVDSLTSPHDRLTSHLKDEDFLWAEKHPQATFQSTSIASGSDVEGRTHTVTGNIEIRGKTKQITFPATLAVADGKVSADTEFSIDRKDFEVMYKGKADDLVQDKVVLTISLVAPRS